MAAGSFTSPLAERLAPDVVDRFTRYVRIDTQSRRDRDRSPSTPGQLDLGRLLVEELRAMGLGDAELDENGYVMATLPPAAAGNGGAREVVVGLIAHVDTSPDAPGRGVEPIVHRAYDGGVLELPRGRTSLDPATMPDLRDKVGHDLITGSGDTLLGADDKAGVAEIMAAVAHLAAHPELPRPTLRIAFTPDEEIGEGATLFDIARFGAGCAYTLDGSRLGELQDESFSALEALLTIHGVEVHPGQAQGTLVSALRLAAQIVAALPAALTPEASAARAGFIHPYELTASVDRAWLRAIIRDFDEQELEAHAALLERTVRDVLEPFPRARYELEVRRQYRNMRAFLARSPAVVAAAEAAIRAEGIEPIRSPIRGGTDGSRLSEMGLPTPNIFTGGHEYHSVREWASVQEMAAAAATIIRLAEVWTLPEYAEALARDAAPSAAPRPGPEPGRRAAPASG
jgi:tripeptide aminopeptidase